MKYNKTDEEYINMFVTGMSWRDIIDIFKRNADICNPEILDLTEVKEYIQNATNSIYNASGLLEANNVKTLNKRLDNIKEELYRCYEKIDEIEESSYVNQNKNIKDKEIEEIER